jgi:hypothetical protein
MAESSNRKELERRLEQARRIADLALDPLTKERLQRLVHELEEQLRSSGAEKHSALCRNSTEPGSI